MRKIARREFLVRAGGAVSYALMAPDFVRQARDYMRSRNAPLIIAPPDPVNVIHAVKTEEGYQLNLGPPATEIPEWTWRECIQRYDNVDPAQLHIYELEDEYGVTPDKLDQPCYSEHYADAWCLEDSPNALAFSYLLDLDLAPLAGGDGRGVGGLSFLDCPGMCSTYRAVHADTKTSLGYLQERLKQLGEATEVKLGAG